MFEKASKLKLRFTTSVGYISAEDLWDLPLLSSSSESLDNLAKNLNRLIKETEEESFVKAKTVNDSVLELKFGIVKHIIEVKLEEEEKAKSAAINKVKKQKIMAIMARKEDSEMEELSKEDLEKLLEDL